MTHPTQRAVIAFSISVPIALLIVCIWRGYWYFALYYPSAVAALMAGDFMSAPHSKRVGMEALCPRQIFLGRSSEVKVSITTAGYGRPVRMEALLEASGEMEPPRAVTGTTADGAMNLSLPVVPLRRGKIVPNAVWLRWRGPLGLVEFIRRDELSGSVDVTPDIRSIYDAAIRFFASDAEFGTKSQRLKGDGTEFDDLRDYERGMDYRLIDWKSSARHLKILCKEFRQERNHHIMLGFDTGRLMTEPLEGQSKLDRAINAGLLLGRVSLYNGDFLGGCAFDVRFRYFIKPERGASHFMKFQRFASELAYRTEETNFTLGIAELNARLSRRALVVLFTEFADAIQAELLIESLRWMTRRHAVIFVTFRDAMLAHLETAVPNDFSDAARAVIADDFLRERQIVFERIARLGVHCLDTNAASISSALLNRYLMIKKKGLL
ncbi:MAG: DUF58 domain-containing protein [Synergistaceae bacterium]|jgi:uncharacterized protein (DUF58 family)|nr:DUF58 domain-containing protein [Synergistaceae bacterium]